MISLADISLIAAAEAPLARVVVARNPGALVSLPCGCLLFVPPGGEVRPGWLRCPEHP